MTTRSRAAVLLALVFALVTSCANIPEESLPQPVREGNVSNPNAVPQPPKDADPFTLVRNFVMASGDSDQAKGYLTEDARRRWPGDAGLLIVDDTFGTVPPSTSDDTSPNEQTVVLRGRTFGRIGSDKAFIANAGQIDEHVRVVRQQDGQWRITQPPSRYVLTKEEFDSRYTRTDLYFFETSLGVLVPDPRYVPTQPRNGLPARAIDALLSGPSDALRYSLPRPFLPETRANVGYNTNGTLVVNLTKLGEPNADQRNLIAAQIVLSLKDVAATKIRIEADGEPLIADHPDWRVTDVPSYSHVATPRADLPGLLVSTDGRVRSLRDGQPVPGPAGSGEYNVQNAAQSIDGVQLAVVEQTATGARLRVGRFGEQLREVPVAAATLTRPTWQASNAPNGSGELWTVADGNTILRVVRTSQNSWVQTPIDASELFQYGPITELRLSRDGARLAAIAGGKLVVGTVVRTPNSVSVASPRLLQQGMLSDDVVGVDWLDQTRLVAVTSQGGLPVVNVSVDGMQMDRYSSSNLTAPVRGVTAAPSRQVVVIDSEGMWTASDVGQVWRPHPQKWGAGAKVFYPG
ncbi:sporulation and spore germination protein [Herbihabitans rhizosphaerae]|uniref:Sporulation and spore germination protein n=1 Tax=Herbihabitans rhizosphaerae TaxID=1872711 RepID=A0A4Q7KFK2_9PSEU|nr:LpqB family beta-propeller domain-containing protein [Herbihabitans rhizosphaerae]RZS33993.1 sporulation and spore germination protein [Herbihabitans rhizosphaerae]